MAIRKVKPTVGLCLCVCLSACSYICCTGAMWSLLWDTTLSFLMLSMHANRSELTLVHAYTCLIPCLIIASSAGLKEMKRIPAAVCYWLLAHALNSPVYFNIRPSLFAGGGRGNEASLTIDALSLTMCACGLHGTMSSVHSCTCFRKVQRYCRLYDRLVSKTLKRYRIGQSKETSNSNNNSCHKSSIPFCKCNVCNFSSQFHKCYLHPWYNKRENQQKPRKKGKPRKRRKTPWR